ncbi:hypothetical protein BROUX41_004702 [Berkeleyomyces rouxiae]|uniref:uncharacterized protein n=1 Tax=Berkeleyomyces rouxiae TaxID=2035830 RepID=UPI003B7DA1B1
MDSTTFGNPAITTRPWPLSRSGSAASSVHASDECYTHRSSIDFSWSAIPRYAPAANTWSFIRPPFEQWDADDETAQTPYSPASAHSDFPHHTLLASTLDVPAADSMVRIGHVRSGSACVSAPLAPDSCVVSPVDAPAPTDGPVHCAAFPSEKAPVSPGSWDCPQSPGYTDIILSYLEPFQNSIFTQLAQAAPSKRALPPLSTSLVSVSPADVSPKPNRTAPREGKVECTSALKSLEMTKVTSFRGLSHQRPDKPRPKAIYAPALFDYYGIDFFSPEQAAVAMWHYDLHSPPPGLIVSPLSARSSPKTNNSSKVGRAVPSPVDNRRPGPTNRGSNTTWVAVPRFAQHSITISPVASTPKTKRQQTKHHRKPKASHKLKSRWEHVSSHGWVKSLRSPL